MTHNSNILQSFPFSVSKADKTKYIVKNISFVDAVHISKNTFVGTEGSLSSMSSY